MYFQFEPIFIFNLISAAFNFSPLTYLAPHLLIICSIISTTSLHYYRAKDLLAAKTVVETEKIITRLKSEAEEERMQIVNNAQDELDALREKAQTVIDIVKDAEIR